MKEFELESLSIQIPWTKAGLVIDAHVARRLHFANHRVARSNIIRIRVINRIDALFLRTAYYSVEQYDDCCRKHVRPIGERAGALADDEFVGSGNPLVITLVDGMRTTTEYRDGKEGKRRVFHRPPIDDVE